jgi:tetratricopeptide (TPR) repeat protein
MNDIFAVQDDIANSVAFALEVTMAGDNGEGGIETIGTENVNAYQKYLDGLQQANIGSNSQLMLAIISFRQALAWDPDFFEARLGLADTIWTQSRVGGIAVTEARTLVKPLLERLLDDRPDNTTVMMLDARFRGFENIEVDMYVTRFTAAIERTPNEPRLYREISALLDSVNRYEEALEWLNRGDGAQETIAKAIEINPNNANVFGLAAGIHLRRKAYAEEFAMNRKGMEADPLDFEYLTHIAHKLYGFGLMKEGDKYLQRAVDSAPARGSTRMTELMRLVLLNDNEGASELSERQLRDDIEVRYGAYAFAAMVFASTMTELGKHEEALTILEELLPDVTSVEFYPQSRKQLVLQTYAVLLLAQSEPHEELLKILGVVVPQWDESYPGWRSGPDALMAIDAARGETKQAVEIMIGKLEGPVSLSYLLYPRNVFLRKLIHDPAVEKRISELNDEAEQAGRDVWDYIVEHDLQL